MLRLKGKGVPAHGGAAAGDLYVRLVVALPDKPDAALKSFAEGWPGRLRPPRQDALSTLASVLVISALTPKIGRLAAGHFRVK